MVMMVGQWCQRHDRKKVAAAVAAAVAAVAAAVPVAVAVAEAQARDSEAAASSTTCFPRTACARRLKPRPCRALRPTPTSTPLSARSRTASCCSSRSTRGCARAPARRRVALHTFLMVGKKKHAQFLSHRLKRSSGSVAIRISSDDILTIPYVISYLSSAFRSSTPSAFWATHRLTSSPGVQI